MKVRMVAQITGTHDGQDYPRPGEVVDLPDEMAADLVANGYAVEPKVEEHAVADESDVETATTRRRRAKS